MSNRPFDLLQDSIGRNVMVELKDGITVRGTLMAFDVHMNLVLDSAEKLVNGETRNRYGKLLLRGDNVLLISP